MWYDIQQVLSYNKIMNMVMSNRGGGKTFRCTRWVIDDFKKTKKQAVWVRRWQTELDGENGILINNKFFDAVKNEGFYPDDELTIEGNLGIINGEVAIHFVALSTSRSLKSNNFPYVNKIIFDEFIIAKGRTNYLKDEVEIFLDLFETVARMRDNVRAVLLANSITVVNPYFMFWNIKPIDGRRFTTKGQVCLEMFTDADFIAAKKKTKFGQLTSGTRYSDYAIENKWLLDNDDFIAEKTPDAKFEMALKYDGEIYGFWADYQGGYIYVNKQFDPYTKKKYSLTRDDHSPNFLMIKSLNDSKVMKSILFCFRNDMMRFSDHAVKGKCYEFMGMFLR